jgi:carboxyl-terminal processing protease
VVAVLGMVAGAKFQESGHSRLKHEAVIADTRYSGRQVEEIIRFLETKYVGDVSTDELVTRAIEAIMTGLDPHTHYFPPDQMDELEERTMGHYVGIGVEVTFFGDSLIILYPKDDSPAERAGIVPGDYVVAIDGHSTINDTLQEKEVIDMIKGSKGTKVKLTLQRMMSDSLRIVEVMRDEIKVPSVPVGYMIDTMIAYIKIDRFINSTYKEFMDRWEELATQHQARHLVLDLRDNPGGYLKEAVNILSQIFPDQGTLLVYTEGKNQERYEYRSTGKVFFPIENVCILINENSASASEIIAGCIQDQDRGLIIGSRSFGKGLVQEQFDLSNGGVLRMTVSKYYTPTGRLIQKAYSTFEETDTLRPYKTAKGREVFAGGGILPDIEVRDDVNWHSKEMGQWMDIISEYAIRHNLIAYQGEIVPVVQIREIRKQLPVAEKMLTELNALALKRMAPAAFDSLMRFQENQKEQLLRVTESAMIAYRTGEEGWYRSYNEKDPVIRKAREMVRLDVLMALKQQ